MVPWVLHVGSHIYIYIHNVCIYKYIYSRIIIIIIIIIIIFVILIVCYINYYQLYAHHTLPHRRFSPWRSRAQQRAGASRCTRTSHPRQNRSSRPGKTSAANGEDAPKGIPKKYLFNMICVYIIIYDYIYIYTYIMYFRCNICIMYMLLDPILQ